MKEKNVLTSLCYVSVTYVASRTNELLEKQIQNELNMEPGSEKIVSLNGLPTRVTNTLHMMEESQTDVITVSRILSFE